VAAAGAIFVGHGQGHDNVHDHPSSHQLRGASVMERRLFLPPSATSLRWSRDWGLHSSCAAKLGSDPAEKLAPELRKPKPAYRSERRLVRRLALRL